MRLSSPISAIAALLLIGAPALCAGQGAKSPSPAPSSSTDANVAIRFGTLGLGLEASKLVTGHLGVRVGGAFFSVNSSPSRAGISYQASVKLHSGYGLVDFYPSERGSFHLTGGVWTNPLTLSGTGQPGGSGTYTINGHSYTASQVGSLTLEAKFPSVSPFAGLGFGTPANRHSGLKFLFDIGAVIGQPTVSLTSTAAASNAQLANDLAAQIATTQSDFRKNLKVYPILALGVGYRF
jgi:hypothetical protein